MIPFDELIEIPEEPKLLEVSFKAKNSEKEDLNYSDKFVVKNYNMQEIELEFTRTLMALGRDGFNCSVKYLIVIPINPKYSNSVKLEEYNIVKEIEKTVDMIFFEVCANASLLISQITQQLPQPPFITVPMYLPKEKK